MILGLDRRCLNTEYVEHLHSSGMLLLVLDEYRWIQGLDRCCLKTEYVEHIHSSGMLPLVLGEFRWILGLDRRCLKTEYLPSSSSGVSFFIYKVSENLINKILVFFILEVFPMYTHKEFAYYSKICVKTATLKNTTNWFSRPILT